MAPHQQILMDQIPPLITPELLAGTLGAMWTPAAVAQIAAWGLVALVIALGLVLQEIRERRALRRRVDLLFAWYHPGMQIGENIRIVDAHIQPAGIITAHIGGGQEGGPHDTSGTLPLPEC